MIEAAVSYNRHKCADTPNLDWKAQLNEISNIEAVLSIEI